LRDAIGPRTELLTNRPTSCWSRWSCPQATDRSVNAAARQLFRVAPRRPRCCGSALRLKKHIRTAGLAQPRPSTSSPRPSCWNNRRQMPRDPRGARGLPGVGRKTANVLNVALATDHVDTHIFR
jgi:endonuclease III